ncbi:CYFA0S18e01706g1_1 [Cyberlindnera fabianii]|uniref:CYFA0S18e01706g1_1 n=1 Tax=Cyberlindnera fabianii TaxID=36022 RepID=A0A061B651_CYBFA|nr:CYFA0S18e01706g1_1 [Cyberlindnera fabianii]
MSVTTKPSRRQRSRQMPTYLVSLQEQLLQSVDLVLSEPTTHIKLPVTYQRLYKSVEFLCRDRHQSQLSNTLFDKIQERTSQLLAQYQSHASDNEPLASFVILYDIIDSKLKALQKIYLFLDRTYLLHHPTKKPIIDFGMLNLYGEMVQGGQWDLLLERFISSLNDLRSNPNSELSSTLVDFWKRFYKVSKWSDIDTTILQSTQNFYRDAHNKIIDAHPSETVFDVFYDAVVREQQFWTTCELDEKVITSLKHATVSEMIFQNFQDDAPKFVLPLFQKKMYTSLVRLFQFIQNSNTKERPVLMNAVTTQWGCYIVEYVSHLITTHTDDVIEALIRSKKNLNIIVEKFLNGNVDMEYKLREFFQTALTLTHAEHVNKRLHKYIDNFFRNIEGDHDENLKVLHDIILIFKSTSNKESFMNTEYRRDLAKRLLHQTTKDITLELELLTLIEQEINPEIVHSLKSMFDDLKESKQLKENFHTISTVDFTPQILKHDKWPQNDSRVVFPDELQTLLDEFKDFYISTNDKYQKRVLKWVPNLGTMNITAHFPLGDQELQVSTSQGIVLVLFNDHDSLSFDEIKKMTKMETRSIAAALYSLTQGKYKVLTKDTVTGRYSMNATFTDKKKKRIIKIKPIQVKMKNGEVLEEEDIDTSETPLADPWAVEAFIVRLMKSETSFDHKSLIERVQSEMVTTQQVIKSCIDSLLDKEYISRVDASDLYVYIP